MGQGSFPYHCVPATPQSDLMYAAAFSPIIMDGAAVLLDVTLKSNYIFVFISSLLILMSVRYKNLIVSFRRDFYRYIK